MLRWDSHLKQTSRNCRISWRSINFLKLDFFIYKSITIRTSQFSNTVSAAHNNAVYFCSTYSNQKPTEISQRDPRKAHGTKTTEVHTFEQHFEHTCLRQNLHLVAQAPNNENLVLLHVKHTCNEVVHTSQCQQFPLPSKATSSGIIANYHSTHNYLRPLPGKNS